MKQSYKMGYFDGYLTSLHKELLDNLENKEISRFGLLFGQECNLETIQGQFILLIELATYLVQKIQDLQRDNSKAVFKSNKTLEYHLNSDDGNNETAKIGKAKSQEENCRQTHFQN